MKIISLILSLLLFAVQPVSAVVMVGFGQSTEPSGPEYIWLETFEDMVNGDLWSSDSNWTYPSGAVTVCTASNTTAADGTISGKVEYYASERFCARSLTAITSGKATIEFDFYADVVNIAQWMVLSGGGTMGSAGNRALLVRISDTGYVTDYSGSYHNLTAAPVSAQTWHHVEVEIDLDTDTVNYWINGVAASGNPYAAYTAGRNIDNIAARTVATVGQTIYIDNIGIYAGARQ